MINIDWIHEVSDICINCLGKYARWLNIRGRRICFILWVICLCYWFFRNLGLGLYSQSFFCLFSLGLNIYGFFNWKNKGIGK